MAVFTMPALGADMDEGILLEWLVAPGDQVRRGDVVAAIETAKSTVEVECFDTGTVERLLVEPGTTVAVGGPLAVIATEVARPGEPAAPTPPAAPAAAPPAAPAPPAEPAPPAPRREPAAPRKRARRPAPSGKPLASSQRVRAPARQKMAEPGKQAERREQAEPGKQVERREQGGGTVSPLVRHLAEEEGVDLATVRGSGRGGVVVRADVARAAHGGARPRVSPLARRLAAELGVEPGEVHGTGADGAVRADDVRRTAAARAREAEKRPRGTAAGEAAGPATGVAAPARTEEEPPPVAAGRAAAAEGKARDAAMRRAVGDLMSRSKREIPHYYLSTTLDLASAVAWMHEHNRGRPVGDRLVPAALLLKAAARAARQVPDLNGFWIDGGPVPGSGIHLGVAVALRGGGLIAPALHDADTLTVPQLMSGLRDLAARARSGRLRGSETTEATITVTSLGDQGVEAVFGVIQPPQVALVGFGRVSDRPAAVGGLIGVRPMVTATLSADHRATDGAVGARYLTALDRLLQEPEEL